MTNSAAVAAITIVAISSHRKAFLIASSIVSAFESPDARGCTRVPGA